MIKFKPYPPCCPNCSYTYPDIYVSDGFWSKGIGDKEAELENKLANHPNLSDALQPQIDKLASGHDLVEGA